MIRHIVSSFVSKLTKKDIEDFLKQNEVSFSSEEMEFCFSYLKKNWPLLFEDRKKIYQDLKANLTSTTYHQIEPILLFYEHKYQSYL